MALSVFICLCVFLFILENRLQGLFLEMNPDGSVRGSPEQRQNCKQLLQTKVKEPEYIH